MPMPSAVGRHPDRAEIELLLAARVSARVIERRFGVAASSARRHRIKIQTADNAYWRALCRHLRERGLSKRHFMKPERETANV